MGDDAEEPQYLGLEFGTIGEVAAAANASGRTIEFVEWHQSTDPLALQSGRFYALLMLPTIVLDEELQAVLEKFGEEEEEA